MAGSALSVGRRRPDVGDRAAAAAPVGEPAALLLEVGEAQHRIDEVVVGAELQGVDAGARERFAQRHEVTAVRLFDPLEMDLPDIGLVTMKDAESGEQIVVDTHNKRFRERFAAAAERRETGLREALARAGVDTLELGTDDDLVDAVLRFADLKKQRSRLANWSGGGRSISHVRPAAAD